MSDFPEKRFRLGDSTLDSRKAFIDFVFPIKKVKISFSFRKNSTQPKWIVGANFTDKSSSLSKFESKRRGKVSRCGPNSDERTEFKRKIIFPFGRSVKKKTFRFPLLRSKKMFSTNFRMVLLLLIHLCLYLKLSKVDVLVNNLSKSIQMFVFSRVFLLKPINFFIFSSTKAQSEI